MNIQPKPAYSRYRWPWPGALTAALLILSLVLVACGGEATFVAGPASPEASRTAAAPATETTLAPAATATVVASTTAEPSFTPTGLPTPRATTAPATVSVIDATLKSELTIWEAMPDKQAGVVRELGTTFGKAYPGVKVTTLHYDPSELLYAVEEAAKSGKLPDLILASADYVVDFNAVKALQPADKVLDKSFLASLAPNAVGGSNTGGTQWGVPFTYSGTPVMLYNKKLVATPPATWEELSRVVKPLYDPKTRSIGLAMDATEPYILTGLVGAFGGSVLDARNQPDLNTPAVVNSLNFLSELLRDRTIRSDSRLKDNQIDYAFRDGRLAVLIGGDWLMDNYASFSGPGGSSDKLELGVAPLPKVDKTGSYPVPYSNSKTFFLGAKTGGDRLKAAKTFLTWLARPEQQSLILNKAQLLPATSAFLAGEAVQNDPAWSGLLKQLEISKPQPPVLEMRAVWEAVRPGLQDVIAGVAKPADAAKQMQQTALENVSKLAVK